MLTASALDTDPEGMALLARVLRPNDGAVRAPRGFSPVERTVVEPRAERSELSALKAEIASTLAGMDAVLGSVPSTRFELSSGA